MSPKNSKDGFKRREETNPRKYKDIEGLQQLKKWW